MMSVPLANPIFGVIARTQYGRDHLKPEYLQPWVGRWLAKPDPKAWWINQQAGIALFQPDYCSSDTNSVICIRGSIIADGVTQRPQQISAATENPGLAFVLQSILERDTSVIRELRGQFAIVCWDERRKVLWLCRDHLGQRCIYTRTDPNYILFCSEMAPLLRSPVYGTELNEEAAFWYLAFGTPPPGQTLAQHVNRIPAAHVLRWEPYSSPMQQRYWSPLCPDAPHTADEPFIVKCRQTLEKAMAHRLDDRSKQGILLSGGVDSTFLAVTAKFMGVSLEAFTSAFDEIYQINETEYAKVVTEWLGLQHHVALVSKEQALSTLNEVVFAAAEPCAAWAVITHFQILAAAQQMGISKMVSGLGADEIFGGYDHFRGFYSRHLRYAQQHPSSNGLDPFQALLMPESQSARKTIYPGVARIFDDTSLRKCLTKPYKNWQYASQLRAFYRECRILKPEAQIMEMMVAHECQHRIPDLLFANFEPISRKMGMEISYPFLDPDVVELVAGLSVVSRYRTPSGEFSLRLRDLMPGFKYAMMKVAEDRVPEIIRKRPRKSYTAPFGQWLFDPSFSNTVLARMQQSRFWERNIVDKNYIPEILAKVVPGPNPWVFQLWGLLTLTAWYDRFVESE